MRADSRLVRSSEQRSNENAVQLSARVAQLAPPNPYAGFQAVLVRHSQKMYLSQKFETPDHCGHKKNEMAQLLAGRGQPAWRTSTWFSLLVPSMRPESFSWAQLTGPDATDR